MRDGMRDGMRMKKIFFYCCGRKRFSFLREKKIFFLHGVGNFFYFWGYFRKTFLALILQSD